MLKLLKILVIFIVSCLCRAAIVRDTSLNGFQTYINSIKVPNIQFEELFDHDSLHDADLILDAFASVNQSEYDEDKEYEEELPCKWSANTVCSNKLEPQCVTDLKCIYVVKNKCHLDKMNCGCVSHHVLPSSFCDNFTQPLFKRCNIKVFIQ